jgi:hypothetical protein
MVTAAVAELLAACSRSLVEIDGRGTSQLCPQGVQRQYSPKPVTSAGRI